MSASRRRNVSRRKSEPSQDPEELQPLDEGLEPLEEIADELVPLEEDDDSPVQVSFSPATERDIDQQFEVDVPDMEKAAVPDAVRGPLTRGVGAAAAEIRWKVVAVRFTGAALIPSAIKELVAEIVGPASPAKVVVRRGYGDETVHEATPPELTVSTQEQDGQVTVEVSAADAEPADVPALLAAKLDEILAGAEGRRFEFRIDGSETTPALRKLLAERAAAAGATACRLADGTVLFDRELESLVRLEPAGDDLVVVHVGASDDPARTRAAFDLVLGEAPEAVAKKRVLARYQGPDGPDGDELGRLTELLGKGGATGFALQVGDGEIDVRVPRLLRIAKKGEQTALALREAGRSRAAVFSAWRRELPAVVEEIGGQRVTVDLPEGFVLDAEAERILVEEGLAQQEPKSVTLRIAGQDAEPFWPVPLVFEVSGDPVDGQLRTGTWKPAELMRAIERRLPAAAGHLRGRAVRLEVTGEAAISRSTQRTLVEGIESAGATALELVDHGVSDVVLPRSLQLSEGPEGAVHIQYDRGSRDDEQLSLALQRELDAADLPDGGHYVLTDGDGIQLLVDALVGRGASVVELAGDPHLRLHPAFFEVARDGERVELRASAEDAAGISEGVERELEAALPRVGPLAERDVVLVWPGGGEPLQGPAATLCARLVADGARSVSVDHGDGVAIQHHPEPSRELVEILGRKDEGSPPMVLLGIDQGVGLPGGAVRHRERVLHELGKLQGLLDGRRILLVERDGGADRAFDDSAGPGRAVLDLVRPWGAAVLGYRTGSRRRPAHFEVLASSVKGLSAGSRVRDPRPSAR